MAVIVKILAALSLIFGAMVAFSNWASALTREPPDPDGYMDGKEQFPLIGGFFICLGLLGFDATRPFAWAGFLIDFVGTIIFFAMIIFWLRGNPE